MGEKRKVLISGGAGFIGSWLCERMVNEGWSVICADNLVSGSRANVTALEARGPEHFIFIHWNICDPEPEALTQAMGSGIDLLINLACPASPVFYARLPLETMRTGSAGTWNLLEIARRFDARFLMASTSEVYGDPLVHPQDESYTGNVNPIGPRSVYDESKRFSETLVATYQREYKLNAGIARIFNTYGPRMQIEDGRVVSNFVCQALLGEPLTVYGDGSQTRSFCYVSDTIEGLLRLADSDYLQPVNIGNPDEHSIGEFAQIVLDLVGLGGKVVFRDLPADDPKVRRPDITRAKKVLGWEPRVRLHEGLAQSIAWFKDKLPKHQA